MGLWFVASIGVRASAPLAEIAGEIARALRLPFVLDSSGRYEEYPAYCTRVLGIELALLGTPLPADDLGKGLDPNFYLVATTLRYPERPLQEVDLSEHILSILKDETALECWKSPMRF